MHFLDTVFPLQYPMYKPEALEGGRGWLLNLLLQTEPFYHASLALSAYHRRMIMLAKVSHAYQAAALVQQEKHLEICMDSVRQSAEYGCPNMKLGIVTSVVQLFFFEVLSHLMQTPSSAVLMTFAKLFTGCGNTWQTHLRAAVNMYQNGVNENLAPYGLTEDSRTILRENLPVLGHENMALGEVVNYRFLSGTIVWLDIISSITAGRAPCLMSSHALVISHNSQIKLEGVMGCRNWVMLQIGRIAALHEQKTQAMRQEHFDCTKLKQTVIDINRQVQYGLGQLALESMNVSERGSAAMKEPILDSPTLVTHVFAYMASLYLHLVINGYQRLEALEPTISEAMEMLRTQTPKKILPALVFPLFIIGSVARRGDQQFFRDIFSSPPLLDPLLKHRGRILPLLEEIWNKRQTMTILAWEDCLESTHDILLL